MLEKEKCYLSRTQAANVPDKPKQELLGDGQILHSQIYIEIRGMSKV